MFIFGKSDISEVRDRARRVLEEISFNFDRIEAEIGNYEASRLLDEATHVYERSSNMYEESKNLERAMESLQSTSSLLEKDIEDIDKKSKIESSIKSSFW